MFSEQIRKRRVAGEGDLCEEKPRCLEEETDSQIPSNRVCPLRPRLQLIQPEKQFFSCIINQNNSKSSGLESNIEENESNQIYPGRDFPFYPFSNYHGSLSLHYSLCIVAICFYLMQLKILTLRRNKLCFLSFLQNFSFEGELRIFDVEPRVFDALLVLLS